MNNLGYSWRRSLQFIVMVTMLLSACLSPSSLLAEETKNTMALPDWAYGQRQRLSPILIQGEVTEVNCLGTQCTLTMTILEVLRNQSQETLEPGEAIVITFVGNGLSEEDSSNPFPPPIGSPDMAVAVPCQGDQKYAWLRPTDGNSYELMAGEYGFGPNLEDVYR